MKILKWFRKLFNRKPAIQIIVNDNLSSLQDVKISCVGRPVIDFEEVNKPRVNSRGEEVVKTVTRTIIQFVKNNDEYQVFLIVQGQEFYIDNWRLMTDKLLLMVIKENELDSMMHKFSACHYDIEVR